MIDQIVCPICGIEAPIEEFDWEEGDGMVCPSCDKYFLFDWDSLDYTVDDEFYSDKEPF